MMVEEILEPKGRAGQNAGCGFVEVLNDARDARPLGFRVGGSRPGPTVVVAGYSPTATAIYDRLLELPTLPWLRGSLVLVSLDALGAASIDDELVNLIGPVDRILHLPFPAPDDSETTVQQGYWSVLKLCTELKMISGRGVNISN